MVYAAEHVVDVVEHLVYVVEYLVDAVEHLVYVVEHLVDVSPEPGDLVYVIEHLVDVVERIDRRRNPADNCYHLRSPSVPR